MRKKFTHFKRKAAAIVTSPYASAVEQLAHLRGFVAALGLLRPGPFVFNLADANSRAAMIDLLWQPDRYQEALHHNTGPRNPELTRVLEAATANSYSSSAAMRDNAAYNYKRAGLFEGVFSAIVRLRSAMLMPFLTLLLSVVAVMTHTPHFFMEVLRLFYRGVIADDQWTFNLIDEALDRNPGPPYEELEGVGAAMLDNLSIQVDYGGTFTTDAHGTLQHMTLWQSMAVPKAAAPAGFDASQIGAHRKPTLALLSSVKLYTYIYPPI